MPLGTVATPALLATPHLRIVAMCRPAFVLATVVRKLDER
jgi:hypothetical protein